MTTAQDPARYEVVRSLRFHTLLLVRLDRLTPYLLSKPDLAPRGALSESDKLRLALELGVRTLERLAARGLAGDDA